MIPHAHDSGEVSRYRRELEAKNRELTKAVQDLERTRDMLLQQEKLASIGQLAAGVAHEINNPIAFISSNLRTLEDYVTSLCRLLKKTLALRDTQDSAARQTAWQEIDELAEQVDLEFILDDVKELLPQSLEGIERVRQIIAALKSFSRADESKREISDIHDCIHAALNIVWNELKYHVTLKKEFGDVPPVDCYPQQVTQVLVNLLINAGQAIPDKGTITIQTFQQAEKAIIRVIDDGTGIPETIRARIFDPFFTTKDVGQGTGLGLSIVYGIIQKHGGSIICHSDNGRGTTFTIELPLTMPHETGIE